MKRLFWLAVGAGAAVVVLRKSSALTERYLPPGASDVLGTVGRVAGAARVARTEFSLGLAEREQQLRADLIGDVDLDALRADRARAKPDRADRVGSEPSHRAGPGGRRRVPRDWADGPTEDPEDGDLPYSFF